jgi:hypothetical protein
LAAKCWLLANGCVDDLNGCALDVHAVFAVLAFNGPGHYVGQKVLAYLPAHPALRHRPEDVAGVMQSNAFHGVPPGECVTSNLRAEYCDHKIRKSVGMTLKTGLRDVEARGIFASFDNVGTRRPLIENRGNFPAVIMRSQ